MKRNLFVAITVALLLSACGRDFNLPVTNSDATADEKYKVGVMNGVKLKIPEMMLDAGFTYEGEPRGLMLSTASTAATFDSRINDFAINVRLSDLQPIRTPQDRRDWIQAQYHQLLQTTWMGVDFDNQYPLPTDKPPYGARMLPNFGPFDMDSNKPFGLVHFESVQSVDDGDKNGQFHGHAEYFFDESSMTTIECETHRQVKEPFALFSSCHHRFLVPELHIVVTAYYRKKDLPRWREIESRVREIAHGFIVR